MKTVLEISLIAITAGINCALLGTLLFLKRRILLADVTAHSVLLGFVLGFFVTESLHSPLLIVFATASGLACLLLCEFFSKIPFMKVDAAQVLMLSYFFSLAILCINLFGEKAHLDSDAVLLGELAFAPFLRYEFQILGFAFSLAKAEALALLALMLNSLFIVYFYKPLNCSLFDASFARQAGLSPNLLHYSIIILTAFTAITAFQALGTLLSLSFFALPAAAAALFARSLKSQLAYAVLFIILSCPLGYSLAILGDFSIAGSMAAFMGLFFAILLFLQRSRKMA